MNIVQMMPEHLQLLALQNVQLCMEPRLSKQYGADLAQHGQAYAGVEGNTVIICAGVLNLWEGRMQAWALVSREAGPHFATIHKAVRRFLDMCDARRIETAVDTQFEAGHRWARLLGFERECTMKAYAPDGRDCDLYARVQWKQ